MSQKSSVPQAVSFVLQALKRDRVKPSSHPCFHRLRCVVSQFDFHCSLLSEAPLERRGCYFLNHWRCPSSASPKMFPTHLRLNHADAGSTDTKHLTNFALGVPATPSKLIDLQDFVFS
jgi:hypothetical protein